LKEYTVSLRDKDKPVCDHSNDRDSLVSAMELDSQAQTTALEGLRSRSKQLQRGIIERTSDWVHAKFRRDSTEH